MPSAKHSKAMAAEVVHEQERREGGQLAAIPAVVQHFAERFGRGGGRAALRHVSHQVYGPFGIGHGEPVAGEREHRHRDAEQDRPPDRAHRRRPGAREEGAQYVAQAGARAVDLENRRGWRGRGGEQAAVERDCPRHAERGQGGAIERGQAHQFRRPSATAGSLLHPRHQGVQLAPARFALLAELAALERGAFMAVKFAPAA